MNQMINGNQKHPALLKTLSMDDVNNAYRILAGFYEYVPPMIIWRAWEYAAYKGYTLAEPVLDLGCGDGRFFRLLWPEISDVVGIDADPFVVEQAKGAGLYKAVHLCSADKLPVQPSSFSTVFANCSLEHMNNIGDVIGEVSRCLRPDGAFVLSVVTNYWSEMDILSDLIGLGGATELADSLRRRYIEYHNLVNPFSIDKWIAMLEADGFAVTEYCPIVPKMTGKFFMFLDHLWHLQAGSGEFGSVLYKDLKNIHNFQNKFCTMLNAMLETEDDSNVYLGVVIRAIRR